MDTFNHREIAQMIEDLNPHKNFKTIQHTDANWSALEQEARNPLAYDTNRCVKTKTPTLMQFDNHYGFVYRRFDGTSWHTQLCQLDTNNTPTGLTALQRTLKDNIDTIFALTHAEHTLKWITPIDKKTKKFDTRYQLLQFGSSWMCCIDDAIYASSTQRRPPNRSHTEITFSTHAEPVFSVALTREILNRLI